LAIDFEEEALINLARKDPVAFGQLYERYIERIYNYVYFRTGNVNDAEDLTARVFFKAMTKIGTYRHMGLPFSACLYRIAHNLVANYHRDNARKREISLEGETQTQFLGMPDHSEINYHKKQEIDRMMKLINDLPKVRQELIILKFIDKMSNVEIGKILHKSEGAVKSMYHRTLLELREKFKLEEL